LLAVVFAVSGTLSGCNTIGTTCGYEKYDSDTLSTVVYTSSDGKTYGIAKGFYTFDAVYPGIASRFADLSPRRLKNGTLDAPETLTFSDITGTATVTFSGSRIEANGVLYECEKDLGGLKEIFEAALADTETEFYNEAYGEAKNRDLDIFLPSAEENAPFVLLLHGGGWSAGSKEDFYATCKALTDTGTAAVTMNYRLTGQGAKYTDMLDDITSALNFLKENAAKYHLKTDQTALMGGSAGAHLSLLYAYKIEEPPIPISFVVSLSGPADFANPDYLTTPIPIEPLVVAVTGEPWNYTGEPPASWADLSPVTHIRADTPYTIVAHGVYDEIVPYSELARLTSALSANGVPYDAITYPNSGHGLSNDPDCALEFYNKLMQAVADRLA